MSVLKPCPSCSHPLDPSADPCPSCGRKNPFRQLRLFGIGGIPLRVLIFVLVLLGIYHVVSLRNFLPLN